MGKTYRHTKTNLSLREKGCTDRKKPVTTITPHTTKNTHTTGTMLNMEVIIHVASKDNSSNRCNLLQVCQAKEPWTLFILKCYDCGVLDDTDFGLHTIVSLVIPSFIDLQLMTKTKFTMGTKKRRMLWMATLSSGCEYCSSVSRLHLPGTWPTASHRK